MLEHREGGLTNRVVRVSHYVKLLASGLGANAKTAELLFEAAPLYDIGKIAVSDHVLRKSDKLNDAEWKEIRDGLRDEAQRWLRAIASPRDAAPVELSGMVASIAHLAYHLGAIRQIDKSARGPREGTFA